MFSIAIVIFREVFEIALILGVLMAATRGLPKRLPWVWLGLIAGIAGAIVIAIFTDAISQLAEGMGQEIMNAIILFIAAFLIAWTVLWMTRHGRELTMHFKEVGQDVVKHRKPMYTLAIVVALSVLREGAEIVMFTYSAIVTGGKVHQLVLGGLFGTLSGIAVGVAIYYGLMKVPTRQIFAVTSWMLIFLVAGMVAQAFGYLAAVGKVPEIVPVVWDTSFMVSEGSWLGKIMHTLAGYSERPSGIQLLSFILTIVGLATALKFYAFQPLRHVKKVVIAIVCAGSLGWLPHAAHAAKKVYSPIVHQGEWELEAQGQYDFDHKHADKNDIQEQEYALGYGVTSRWFTEVEGEVEKERNSDGEDLNFRFTQLEWENIIQLTEQGQYWVDAGLFLGFNPNFEDKHASSLVWKLLLEKSLPRWTHSVNLNFNKDVGAGNGAKQPGAGVAWSSRYLWTQYIQPGFEYYADFGILRSPNTYNTQTHQVGPVIYGQVIPHIKYNVGYLFGISPAAPMGELKWVMEYEWRF